MIEQVEQSTNSSVLLIPSLHPKSSDRILMCELRDARMHTLIFFVKNYNVHVQARAPQRQPSEVHCGIRAATDIKRDMPCALFVT